MNIKLNAVKFKTDEKLVKFINDKVSKLEKYLPDTLGAEVTLKVDKPSSEMNKIVEIKLLVRGEDMFAIKQNDTFEEGILECIDSLKTQIEKHKNRRL